MRWLALGAGLIALGFTLSNADWPRVGTLLGTVGVLGFFAILIPQLVCLACDSMSWRWVLRMLNAASPYWGLFRVRAATEALAQSLPGGPVLAEGVTPWLLQKMGIDAATAVTSQVVRRYLLIWSQGVYAALVTLVALVSVEQVKGAESSVLPLVTGGVAVCLLGAAYLLRATCLDVGIAEQLLDLAARLVPTRPGGWLQERRGHFRRTDDATRVAFSSPLFQRIAAGVPLLLGWLVETLETALITRLLGFQWALVLVAIMELLVALMRHLAFVIPAGIGVQDAGYVFFFHALGAPDPMTTGAAFTLLKRAKEACWIAIGYLLLSPHLTGRPFAAAATASSSEA